MSDAFDETQKKFESVLSLKEVEQHNRKDDMWICIDGKVYDQHHSLGLLIPEECHWCAGKGVYNRFLRFIHNRLLSVNFRALKSVFFAMPPSAPISSRISEMRQNFQSFQTDYGYYYRKLAIFIALRFGSLPLFLASLCLCSHGWSICAGCVWQQMSFFGHDFGHNATCTHQQGVGLVARNRSEYLLRSIQWPGGRDLITFITY